MDNETKEQLDTMLKSLAAVLYSGFVGTLAASGTFFLASLGKSPMPVGEKLLLALFLGSAVSAMTAIDQASLQTFNKLTEDMEVELTDG
jgi:hypothetical protein